VKRVLLAASVLALTISTARADIATVGWGLTPCSKIEDSTNAEMDRYLNWAFGYWSGLNYAEHDNSIPDPKISMEQIAKLIDTQCNSYSAQTLQEAITKAWMVVYLKGMAQQLEHPGQ
jgi:hypothetical protein